jgi:small GTP-binding protein
LTLRSLLSEKQEGLWRRERALIHRLLDVLEDWDFTSDEPTHLREALDQLDELFLLVVVGEFNSGKSALINAMLNDEFLKEGVTPTTDRIHIVKYGESASPEIVDEDSRVLYYPADLLRQLHIVDTPGTNAVLRHHEAIVRDFVPRSDMVIFVTSADRPFTQSEREFLETIKAWGKKIVVVINKIDILADQKNINEVLLFVKKQVELLLSIEPAIFTISARAVRTASPGADLLGWSEFQGYLEESLTQQEMIKIKLLNPLGVAAKITENFLAIAAERLDVLQADSKVLKKVEQQLELFESDTAAEFGRHLDRIDKDLLQMRLRGEEFIDDNMRLFNIPQMLRSREMRAAFEQEVVGETPAAIERHIQEIIDWLVERELRHWRMMADELGQRQDTEALKDATRVASGGFAYNRRQLLETIGHRAEQIIKGYNRSLEAERLTATLKESIALVGLIEVGAISLGLILKAVLTTAAADATGILAAGVLGVLGLTIIPFRRSQAKREFRKKMTDLQGELRKALSDSFQRELSQAVNRLHEALAPYRRFIHSEEEQLNRTNGELTQFEAELRALRLEIDPDHAD